MQSPKQPLAHPARHILRLNEVMRRTGFRRAHIYNLMKLDKFPHARRIGLRAVGWDSQEIEQWIAARLDRS
ncbi:AlpA family transcriptional regulator [Pseudomonas flexibilis]|jgi:prophage regulatory protein|uniref:Transcriptional regulator, AlpA family n=1 Tax=Pseudomonas flexibilis TaxID=706570 RepID=A0A1N7A4H7_9PSED|nr:AlpA family phage regulatory protein [Pseudomonas flexibilis]KHL68460.1 AlpA family transcriptional regulator [Pseudomonas flexibilis]SIR33987.1 transcriptional regulator, AlpA family [Pseudomonas flexibilis]